MDSDPLYYVLIPRRDSGYACVGYSSDLPALTYHAQQMADVHGRAFICTLKEVCKQKHVPSLRPPGEKPLVLPVVTKQNKSRKRDKSPPKSSKSESYLPQ